MKELKYLLRFYTQTQLAKMLGYKHRSTITQWIKRKNIPLHKRGLITKEYLKCCK